MILELFTLRLRRVLAHRTLVATIFLHVFFQPAVPVAWAFNCGRRHSFQCHFFFYACCHGAAVRGGTIRPGPTKGHRLQQVVQYFPVIIVSVWKPFAGKLEPEIFGILKFGIKFLLIVLKKFILKILTNWVCLFNFVKYVERLNTTTDVLQLI